VRPQLAALVDRWAVPHWIPLGNVYSVGDVLIAIGVFVAVVSAMRAGSSPAASVRRSELETQPS
jgi:hypothetical protein